jgi:hypothetical protein
MRAFLSAAIVIALGAVAHAAVDAPDVAEARRWFVAGTQEVKRSNWAEAMAAFERSAKLRPHAVTSYNIGVCQRAIGLYTRARATLLRALAEDTAAGGAELSETLVTDSRALLEEIDRLLARAQVTMDPPNAAVAVDGRPLEAAVVAGGTPTLIAGARPPGPGEPPPAAAFTLLVDPGVHVITIARPGFADAVVRREYAPGSSVGLDLALNRLPATLHISSNRPGAAVAVDDVDVGVTPVDVQRPAGTYRVLVREKGFVPSRAEMVVQPGQQLDLRAELVPEKRSLATRWWFWTALGAGATALAVGVYFIAQPPTPVDGGTLGWAVPLR